MLKRFHSSLGPITNRLRWLVLAIFALATAQCRDAEAHWEFTTWGMTIEQVSSASGGKASPVTTAEQALLRLDRLFLDARLRTSTEIQPGVAVDVLFYFDEEGELQLVRLSTRDKSKYAEILQIFVNRYGQPNVSTNAVPTLATHSWRHPWGAGSDDIDILFTPTLSQTSVVLRPAKTLARQAAYIATLYGYAIVCSKPNGETIKAMWLEFLASLPTEQIRTNAAADFDRALEKALRKRVVPNFNRNICVFPINPVTLDVWRSNLRELLISNRP